MTIPLPLPRKFYDRSAVEVARDLIGQVLVRRLDGRRLMGRIVETEAYVGEDDPACHAARGMTPRNRVMYGPPGFSYVYFTYGMYFMLNVVCGKKGFPAAVLIRAAEPLAGLNAMMRKRKLRDSKRLSNGPGKLCIAFDITTRLNDVDVTRRESPLIFCQGEKIATVAWSNRVGIREGTDRMWRCYVPGNPFVSPVRK
ncbi:MAG: DNA-3-methyladenine glycosylase [Acidobacteria bacterium]|nr:DNA-3-methyladenine glycosylase [Acidobacteriota bacterium]